MSPGERARAAEAQGVKHGPMVPLFGRDPNFRPQGKSETQPTNPVEAMLEAKQRAALAAYEEHLKHLALRKLRRDEMTPRQRAFHSFGYTLVAIGWSGWLILFGLAAHAAWRRFFG